MFKYGDAIEYSADGNEWRKGVFVGLNPKDPQYAIHLASQGFVTERKIDRIRKPKQKKEGWINVYKNGVCGSIHATEGEARAAGGIQCIAISRIEWEE